MYEIIIKNGTVFDGVSDVGKKMDIGVANGQIVEIQSEIKTRSDDNVIDAKGKAVAPGFIDIQNHSDSYWKLFNHPALSSIITQGFTTILVGHCGSSLAPLTGKESLKTIQKWHDLSGVNINWQSFEDYQKTLTRLPLGVNVASLTGHATIRRGLIGDSVRGVNKEELAVMEKILLDSLNQGSFGMSLGLVYAHEVNSSAQELESLASIIGLKDKLLSVHLRSEGGQILESLDEVIELAFKTNSRLKISHLKIRGKKNWHVFDYMMNKLESAFHKGVKISFDVYPYDSSWSVLYTYLPKWAYEGGKIKILQLLDNEIDLRKITDYLKDQDYDFDKIIIASAKNNKNFIGKTITEISQNQGVSPELGMLNILKACDTQVTIFDQNLNMEQIELLLASPLSVISTDASGYELDTSELVHPRSFGTVGKFFELVRNKKILKLEDAIKKLTSEPAKIAGLKNRGVIMRGAAADFVVFDPQTISSDADFRFPNKINLGIDWVIINGKLACKDGVVQGSYGKVINYA